MNARHKLNAANILGCTLLAGLIGHWTGSTQVFLGTLAVLLILSVYDGGIRLRGQ